MTHTGLLQRGYKTKLIEMYDKFNNKLSTSLNRLFNRSDTSGYIKEAGEKIDRYTDGIIYAESPGIIDHYITQGYHRGKINAANNPRLKRNSIIIPSKLSIYDNRAIEDLKNRNLGLVTKLTIDIKSDILRIITDDIREGKGIQDIGRDITKTISDISRTRAERIARTELAYSYNTAMAESYKKAGIEEWQWMATLGTTCCEECAELHGEVFNWNNPQPPLHPNCNCSIYPVVINE